MKLVRIYANKLFHNIKFSETGLNVILGQITNRQIKSKDTHNLGKTLLCDLIDFMLLKKTDKDIFLLKHEEFEGCVFFIEILLNDSSYLVIRRSVDEPQRVCLKKSTQPLNSFDITISEWDYEDITIPDAIDKMNTLINFSVIPDFSYRKYINYFLRHQADYSEVFHLSKYKGKDFQWKGFLIELFGYNNELLKEKENIEQEIEEKNKEIKFIENRESINGDKDALKALIELKEQELLKKQKLVDEIDFSQEDTDEHRNLVENIDTQLQIQNTTLYELNRDIERISFSLNTELKQIDVNELKEVFEETKVAFPDEVYIQFQDLLEFNKKISIERNKYLKEQLEEMKQKVPQVRKEIEELEIKRKNALSFLTETSSYKKYKEIQNKFSIIEAQINSLKIQYDQISGYQMEVQKLNEAIDALKVRKTNNKAKTEKMLQEGKHAPIRNIFNDIIKDILNVNGIISLNLNKNGNIDFTAKIQNPDNLNITSKDKGSSYRKLLCMAFDLSLLINYHDDSFFKFTYHDGALEALDERKKIALLNKSREICKKYGLQHIITLIDSDLPHNEDGSIFELDKEEVCLILSDKTPKDKLFSIEF